MDLYISPDNPIVLHLQEYYLYYLLIAPPTLLAIFFTRRYSVPLILYALEFAVYSFAMHTIMHVIVRMTAWFKTQSSMKALREDGMPADAVFWKTPWMNFWEQEQYDPQWVFKFELFLLVAIMALMYRYRPLKTQYVHKSRYKDSASMKPEPKKRGKQMADSDDGWGVPKKRITPNIDPKTLYDRKK